MTTQVSIWQYQNLLPIKIDPKFQLSIQEGNTPIDKLNDIYFKREDKNPTGSNKDRGIAIQLSHAYQKGYQEAVITSTGNAAISACIYSQFIPNFKVNIFISPKTAISKINKLKSLSSNVYISERPISAAHKYALTHNAINLRPSKDPLGTIGYMTIAFELAQQIKNIGNSSIFIPVSSATMFCGIALGFNKLLIKKSITQIPQLHAVQTTYSYTISKDFDQNFKPSSSSLAKSLTAKITSRKNKAIQLIKESRGFGWVVNDQMISEADKLLSKNNIQTSYEGAACLAAYNLPFNWHFKIDI